MIRDETIEAVDHRRQIYLAGRDLEFGDVGQPFLIGSGCTEITIVGV